MPGVSQINNPASVWWPEMFTSIDEALRFLSWEPEPDRPPYLARCDDDWQLTVLWHPEDSSNGSFEIATYAIDQSLVEQLMSEHLVTPRCVESFGISFVIAHELVLALEGRKRLALLEEAA